MKAIFGGAVKKPLMTKVSMRHLNEIVRERNQYSRDAMEAWQDFINLKGRMDTELSKVSKRNNFLVEELESWKQQVRPMIKLDDYDIDTFRSFSNSKPLPNNSRRRPKISRSRSKTTSEKTAGLRSSSTSKRTTPLALPFVSPVRRSNATMPSRRLFYNRTSPKNSSGSVSATGRSLLVFSTPMPPSFVNATRHSVWCYIFGA
jgi:hypothetical protein